MTSTKRSLEIETRYTAEGNLPEDGGLESRVYEARALNADFREAEALILSEPDLDPLQKVRTLLARGDFDQALNILEGLESSFSLDLGHKVEVAEILLERARLAVFYGQWSTAVRLTSEALRLDIPAITQMTLRQVRAVSIFELGDFAAAAREIEACLSLAKLYPIGNLVFYAEVTELKNATQAGNRGLAQAKMTSLWKRLQKSRGLNLDTLLVLIRAEIDLRRARGDSVASLAFLAWTLASLTGDRLYAALAVVDLVYALPQAMRSPWLSLFKQTQSEFQRIANLVHEIESRPESTSAVSIKKATADTEIDPRILQLEIVEKIILVEQGLLIETESRQITSVQLTSQMRLALKCLMRGKQCKEDFFKVVWGGQKFVSHLHDPVIRTLLKRLRKAAPITIASQDNTLELVSSLVVDV